MAAREFSPFSLAPNAPNVNAAEIKPAFPLPKRCSITVGQRVIRHGYAAAHFLPGKRPVAQASTRPCLWALNRELIHPSNARTLQLSVTS